MTPQLDQAKRFAAAVRALIPDMPMNIMVWDATTCRDKGYPNALAGVVLEDSPFEPLDNELSVFSQETDSEFKLEGMTAVKGVFAEPYSSWLLLFYKA